MTTPPADPLECEKARAVRLGSLVGLRLIELGDALRGLSERVPADRHSEMLNAVMQAALKARREMQSAEAAVVAAVDPHIAAGTPLDEVFRVAVRVNRARPVSLPEARLLHVVAFACQRAIQEGVRDAP